MSMLKDAWDALQAVATLTDRVERQADEIAVLRSELRDARERLVAIEAVIQFARGQAPRLPK